MNTSFICSISSVAFPGVYLRLDGQRLSKRVGAGAGLANGQFGTRQWEKFMLTKQADGTFTIGSIAFPGVYLRLDGRNITERNAVGVGVVNGQFGAYAWERFRLTPAIDGTFTIESAEFPGVFLRLDGRISKEYHASGAGTANGQFGAYSWEQFRLIPDLG